MRGYTLNGLVFLMLYYNGIDTFRFRLNFSYEYHESGSLRQYNSHQETNSKLQMMETMMDAFWHSMHNILRCRFYNYIICCINYSYILDRF